MITNEQKLERFDRAYKVLMDLTFMAPEARPNNGVTLERLGEIICNGKLLA